jgi:hypothetical protein
MNNLENIIRNTSYSNTKNELFKIYKHTNDNNNDINFAKISNKNYNQNPSNNNVNEFLNEDNKKNVSYNISPKI